MSRSAPLLITPWTDPNHVRPLSGGESPTHVARAETAARNGAQIILHPGTLPVAVFLQSEDHANFKLAEPIPAPARRVPETRPSTRVVIIASLFENAPPACTTTRRQSLTRMARCWAFTGKCTSRMIAVYEKFISPRRSGFSDVDNALRTDWRVDLLGSMVPRGGPSDGSAGGANSVLSHRLGWHPGEKAALGETQHAAWELIQRSHAVANGCYVAAVNRVGHEVLKGVAGEGIEFWGQSFVAGPSGESLAKARSDQEETLLVPVDLARVDITRTHWPFLRDRRLTLMAT
jgi:N-carbamoylputrescine amidase